MYCVFSVSLYLPKKTYTILYLINIAQALWISSKRFSWSKSNKIVWIQKGNKVYNYEDIPSLMVEWETEVKSHCFKQIDKYK